MSGGRSFAVSALALAASVFAAAQLPPDRMSVDALVAAYRSDLQSKRADVIAKNVTLTTAQASAFWPLFEQYQKEQNFIMDEQMRDIQTFISRSETMDDVAALGLIRAHIDRDAKMAELRRRWLSEFIQVLPVKLAVRVMQIDRRLSLVHQTEFTAQIPLAQ